MAEVISLGETQHETERLTIRRLREALPEDYTLLHSFWVLREGQRFEVDLAVVAPHAVYLVDVKGWSGRIAGYQRDWIVPHMGTIFSPLKKLEMHARAFGGILRGSHPDLRGARLPYVGPAVVLAGAQVRFEDHATGEQDVVTLDEAAAWFQDPGHVPDRFRGRRLDARGHRLVVNAIRGHVHPRTGPVRFREWVVTEQLRVEDEFQEYAGQDEHAGEPVRIRVYRADQFASPEKRAEEENRIRTAYAALRPLQHPNVLPVRHFFRTENENAFVLVTAAVPGETLAIRNARGDRPPLDRQLALMRGVLDGLAHAHAHHVVHRRLTPEAIVAGETAVLTEFDHAKAPRRVGGTVLGQVAHELVGPYAAPEAAEDPSQIQAASDVYSAGVIFYEMLVGAHPFDGKVPSAASRFPHPPSTLQPRLPRGFDEWLQALCATSPAERPTAAEARDRLDALIAAPGEGASTAPAAQSPAPATEVPELHADHSASDPKMSPITEYTVAAARPLPVILLLDRSGSMAVEGKIDVLNQAVQRMISQLSDEDAGLAEVHAAVITFGDDTATVHTPLGPARDIRWAPLRASGRTPMGGALDLALGMIEDREQLPRRAYRPTLVLVSDGFHTDDWDGAFARFQGSERARNSFRLALQVGQDAKLESLQQFVGADGQVFTASQVEDIRKFFRFVTMSVTARSRSATPNVAPEFDETDLDALGF